MTERAQTIEGIRRGVVARDVLDSTTRHSPSRRMRDGGPKFASRSSAVAAAPHRCGGGVSREALPTADAQYHPMRNHVLAFDVSYFAERGADRGTTVRAEDGG